jgi:hypothetical protein
MQNIAFQASGHGVQRGKNSKVTFVLARWRG